MRIPALCRLLVIIVFIPAADVAAAADEYPYNALWSGESFSPSGRYVGMANEMKKLGIQVNALSSGASFSEEILEDIDLVVLAARNEFLTAEEQGLLVRYVQSGGSLLVICGQSGGNATTLNAVLMNFGITITATRTLSTKMTYFERPATTKRRPIGSCTLGSPLLLHLNSGARNIGGREFSSGSPAWECYLAMATRCGKGRVIALSDDSAWQTFG